jgi:Thrombospondin type 3 repeat
MISQTTLSLMKTVKILFALFVLATMAQSCAKDLKNDATNPDITAFVQQDGSIPAEYADAYTGEQLEEQPTAERSESCTTITFNELANGTIVTTQYAGLGVTIGIGPNGSSGVIRATGASPCGTGNTLWSDPFVGPSKLFNFSGPVVSVSLSAGDFGPSDADVMTLTAYSGPSATGSVIATDVVSLPLNHATGCLTLTVAGSGIQSVELTTAGTFLNSVFVDNLTFCVNPDLDDDGVLNEEDNCPNIANAGQEDNDSDGYGDVCDDDDDNDGVLDVVDNCQYAANPGQEDCEGDGLGDVCDPDDDNDGVLDGDDVIPCSNVDATVNIDGCDSGVPNGVLEDGTTFMDAILECAANASNHGDFVSCVSHLTNTWKAAGLITGAQKGAIIDCASGAAIP